MMRVALTVLTAILLAVGLAAPAAAAPTPPPVRRHASGIALLPPFDVTPFIRARERMGPAFEPLAVAWSDARQLAEDHRDVFGYPWMDLAKGELVVRIAKPEAEAMARAWIKSGAPRASTFKPAPTLRPTRVPVRLESTTRSFGQLESVMHEAIGRAAVGFDGENRVWQSGVDDESQRVILVTDRVVDPFLFALAQKYGTEIVAVRVDPKAGPFVSLGAASPETDIARQLGIVGAISAASALLIGIGLLAHRLRRTQA